MDKKKLLKAAALAAVTMSLIAAGNMEEKGNKVTIMHKGKIISVGKNIFIPADAVVEDLNGKYIYPSFIDLYSEYGIDAKKVETPRSYMSRPVWDSKENGPYYWSSPLDGQKCLLHQGGYRALRFGGGSRPHRCGSHTDHECDHQSER